jgi:outer membrane protein insertion porin family
MPACPASFRKERFPTSGNDKVCAIINDAVYKNPRLKNIKLPALFLSLFLLSHFLFFTHVFASDSEKIIKAIEVEGLSRIKQEELVNIICFHIGDVIDREILREGIKRAFKKGIFLDIAAVTEPYDSGVKLKYIVKEIPVIDEINIEGDEEISKGEIRENFLFKEGGAFKEDFLEKAKADLLKFYSRKGFPGAKLKIVIEKDETLNEVNINLMIEEGEPLIIKKINILPEAGDRIKISEGDIYDIGRVEESIGKLKKYYKKQKYIKPVAGPHEFKAGELIIPVIPGPRLEVVFTGNEDISSRKLLKEVLFLEDEGVNWELLRETSRRIKKLYQNNGYDYAQVTGGIETKEDLITVNFFIFEGQRVYLKEIKFEGVNVSPEAIKKIMPMEEDEPFNRTLLTASKESITGFYNALGYLNPGIKEIKEDFRKDGSEVYLTFVVDHGPQIRISEVNIIGNKAISVSDIKDELHIEEDDPYNTVDIGDARYRLISLYNRAGYIDVNIDVESKISSGKAFVTFKITENERSVFGKIVIRGNEKTKTKIIMREFTIKEGEPYNYEALLKTRQRLYKLGLFSDISIKPLKITKQDKPAGVIYKQDILVDLEEGNPGAAEIGLGYGDYEHLRGFVDVSYSNLGGYNRKVGLRAELSSVDKRYILNYREPWLFNKPALPLKIFLIKENRRSVNLDSKEVMYKIDRLSFLVGVEKELTEKLKASLDYEYSLVETTDVKPGAILSKDDTGTLGISSISHSLFYDTRDNPFDPTTGAFNGIVLKVASGAFLSEAEFIKATFQSSWFFQIRKRLVLAVSLRGGVAHGLGETEDLPLIERFFLGGRTSVRGYKQDMLGPKGADDTPTGGNAFAVANLEMRIPVGKGFWVAPFIDAGNVWRRASDIETVLNYTAGIGLRYHTPVGPIRIDYGHKLNNRGEQDAGEVHFSFGHAF